MQIITRQRTITWIAGLAGSALIAMSGWAWNAPLASWLSFILLMRFFRQQEKWYYTLPVTLLVFFFRFLSMHGGWEIDFPVEIAFAVLVSSSLLAGLYFDRFFSKKLTLFTATLVFPVLYTMIDFFISFSPLSASTSVAGTQFDFTIVSQLSSLTGCWGIIFLICWAAPVVNQLWENGFNVKKAGKAFVVPFIVFSAIMAFGIVKLTFFGPKAQTVLIGSITVPHNLDYWGITEAGTPIAEAGKIRPKMREIQDELFEKSKKAADFGAKVIFWSEGNYPLYEDQYGEFINRARDFAVANSVYFAPSILTLYFGAAKNDNMAVMFTPDGGIAYKYEKTYSWFPTDSDGQIKTVQTPWGVIGSVICFDLDNPAFLRQAAQKNVDILLVPGYDTKRISPYHTKEGLERGIEYGFSIVRQANHGTSIAADFNGNILAYQDYFGSAERIMISNVPVKGQPTFYGITGDWFLVLVFVLFVSGIFYYIYLLRRVNRP